MNSIDEQIRQALSEAEQKDSQNIAEEVGVFEMINMSFHGKQAWLTYYMYFIGLIATAAGVYFLMQFLNTDDIKTALGWMMAMQLCLAAIIIIKVIGWQHMQRAELLRELKRLELKILLAKQG